MDGKQIGQRLIELLEQHRETMAEEQLLDTLSAVELREKQGAHAEAGHPRGHGAVTDHGDYLAFASLLLRRERHP